MTPNPTIASALPKELAARLRNIVGDQTRLVALEPNPAANDLVASRVSLVVVDLAFTGLPIAEHLIAICFQAGIRLVFYGRLDIETCRRLIALRKEAPCEGFIAAFDDNEAELISAAAKRRSHANSTIWFLFCELKDRIARLPDQALLATLRVWFAAGSTSVSNVASLARLPARTLRRWFARAGFRGLRSLLAAIRAAKSADAGRADQPRSVGGTIRVGEMSAPARRSHPGPTDRTIAIDSLTHARDLAQTALRRGGDN